MTAETQKAGLDAVLADEEAFRRWYERSAPRVFAYIFNRCGRATEPNDDVLTVRPLRPPVARSAEARLESPIVAE
jgi:hypothetical protein